MRTYNSSVDGVAIQYREYVPAGYDPTLRYPLLAYLHGGGGAMNAVPSDILASADVYKYIVVSIYGRPLNFTPQSFCQGQIPCPSPFYFNSPISGPGEQDVLDMLIDPDNLFNILNVNPLPTFNHAQLIEKIAGDMIPLCLTDVFSKKCEI